MTKTVKISLIVLAILLLLGIILYSSKLNTKPIPENIAVVVVKDDEIASSTNVSDAAIDEDLGKISKQLDILNTSSNEVDASLK